MEAQARQGSWAEGSRPHKRAKDLEAYKPFCLDFCLPQPVFFHLQNEGDQGSNQMMTQERILWPELLKPHKLRGHLLSLEEAVADSKIQLPKSDFGRLTSSSRDSVFPTA